MRVKKSSKWPTITCRGLETTWRKILLDHFLPTCDAANPTYLSMCAVHLSVVPMEH